MCLAAANDVATYGRRATSLKATNSRRLTEEAPKLDVEIPVRPRCLDLQNIGGHRDATTRRKS